MNGTTLQQPSRNPRWQQGLNLVLPFTQVLATYLAFTTGLGVDISTLADTANVPVTPADYTFAIWSFIYPACIVYGIYQALPRQHDNELLRRIRPFTASAFTANTLWAIVYQLGFFWLSVLIIVWMLVSLVLVLIQFVRFQGSFTRPEFWCAVLPLSVFAAWITVATIANTSFTLRASGYVSLLGLSETVWASLMLLIAGGVAAFVLVVSRGNVGYGFTILWAFVGIIVANLIRDPNTLIAVLAGLVAASIGIVFWWSRSRPAPKGI
jgi:hypothetical protein